MKCTIPIIFFSNICHVDSDDGCISPHSSQYLNDKSLLTRTCLMNANEGGVKGRKGSEQDEKGRREGRKERTAKHTCSMMCPCGDVTFVWRRKTESWTGHASKENNQRLIEIVYLQIQCFVLIFAISKCKLIDSRKRVASSPDGKV